MADIDITVEVTQPPQITVDVTPSVVVPVQIVGDTVIDVEVTGVGPAGGVNSVNTRQGDVVLTKTDVGLSNVDNTSDASKPVSTAQAASIATKLTATNNLSDVTDTGTARLNLKTPTLFSPNAVAVSNVASLSGPTTIDGVSLSTNNRVLLTAQTTGSQNGPWIVQAGAWTRPTDWATGATVRAHIALVSGGTTYAGSVWGMTLTGTGNYVIDTDTTTWTMVNRTQNDGRYLRAANNLSDLALPATARTNLGLGNVDNTSDVNKPVSTAQQTALDAKVAGPASSTANQIPVFSDTTGKVVTNTPATVSSTGSGAFASNASGTAPLNSTNSASATFVSVLDLRASGLAATQSGYIAFGRTNSANNQGSIGFYYAGAGSTSNRIDFNFFGGSTLMTLLASGLFGIGTSAPTHSLTLSSTTTGKAHYNTSDQTTNYERVRQYWNTNVYTIASENGGTGTLRGIMVGATGNSLGFFGATPATQPNNTADLGTVLSNLGLRASGANYPISTGGNATFSGNAILSGSIRMPPNTKTAAATLTATTATPQLCDATTGAFTLTLPAANAANGQILWFKKIDSTANAVTLARAGTDTIDGATSYNLTAQNSSIILVSNNSNAWNAFAVSPGSGIPVGTTDTQTLTNKTLSGGSNTFSSIPESAVTNLVSDLAAKKTDSMTTGKLLGRSTAGTGVIEEITLGTNLSFTGTTLNATGGSGGGDVTGPAGAVASNLASFNGTTGKILQDSGKAAPTGAIVGDTDTQTLTNKTLTQPRIAQINDTNGNAVLINTATASAVNQVTNTNAATGSDPSLAATGSDTNIALKLSGKGNKSVTVDDGNGLIIKGNTTTTAPAAGYGKIYMDPATGAVRPKFTNSGSLAEVLLTDRNSMTTNSGTSYVLTDETTTSTTYADLATVQSVTATIGPSGMALVTFSAGVYNVASQKRMSVAVSGASTVAANDDWSIRNDASAFSGTQGMSHLFTGLTAGSNTFTLKFKTASGTGRFFERRITVIPL